MRLLWLTARMTKTNADTLSGFNIWRKEIISETYTEMEP